jgi:hypothetical protein
MSEKDFDRSGQGTNLEELCKSHVKSLISIARHPQNNRPQNCRNVKRVLTIRLWYSVIMNTEFVIFSRSG